MDKSRCPLCGKEFLDILKHFVLEHDVKNMNHLEELVKKAEKNQQRKCDFGNYVEELKNKVRERKISAEEYRELVMKWSQEHKVEEEGNGETGESSD